MTSESGVAQGGVRLKAKEKVLVQLYLHRCEPDDGVFPFEVTQKGLSEHLGIRRSHVAVALQELAKDGLVEAVKGHVEGADRRQNAYCVTSKGADEASSVRERFFELEVSFEDAEGTRTIKVSEIITSRKASLASVINQMDRGGPVRDEIAVMTKPEKKLVSVFCPTCKKQIEVDNVFQGEEVGFDCPGCGRPYRIVPAVRVEPSSRAETAPSERDRSNWTLLAAFTGAICIALALFVGTLCLSFVFASIAMAAILAWYLSKKKMGTPRRKPATRASAVGYTLATSPVLLVIWHLRVAHVDPEETAAVLSPLLAAAAAGYFGFHFYLPDHRGDYLMSAGVLMTLVAAATMVVVDFGPLDVGMAMVLGIAAAVMIVLARFEPMDRDALVLDTALSIGVFLMLLAGAVLAWDVDGTVEAAAVLSVVGLGAVLVCLRVAREATGTKDISSHLVAAIPATVAAGLVATGLFLVEGGNLAAGGVEVALALPFGYVGARMVVNEHWRWRVPLVAILVAVITLVLVAGLAT